MSDPNGIIELPGRTLIMNGGNPLPGSDCPTEWEEAYNISDKLNEGNSAEYPKWKFDCGFKLDFDGGIVYISSRFYPPKTHSGSTWDGSVTVFLLGEILSEKEFDCATLPELQKQVQEYTNTIIEKFKHALL